MSLQLAAAKFSIKAAWSTAKVWVYLLAVLVVCAFLYFGTQGMLKRQNELVELRAFQSSTVARERVRAASVAAYLAAKAEQKTEVRAAAETIVIHDRFTKEAAHEDPATADYLAGRIPQRLRDADARARRSGRLGIGAAGSDGAGPAN